MPNQKSSTAQDLARGKPSEIDFLNGHVVRKGAELGVATPTNHALQVMVKLAERSKDVVTEIIRHVARMSVSDIRDNQHRPGCRWRSSGLQERTIAAYATNRFSRILRKSVARLP